MIVGVAGITHTPLAERIRAPRDTEEAFAAAISRASRLIQQWAPDVTVVFFPDHLNGFLYDLMPAFCVGIQAESIGDWGTIPGRIQVPEALARDCTQACLNGGLDVAFSYRMHADHGYAQVIEYLSEVRALTRTIPIFINCAAPPLPTFARSRALGEAVGRWAERLEERVLILASGGLSHDPPVPTISPASPPEVRARLIGGGLPSHAERLARQQKVTQESRAFAQGRGDLLPLNPQWDAAFLESLCAGRLNMTDRWSDDALSGLAGRGAHEIRTWLAAWSAGAMAGPLRTEVGFSQPIREWITSCAVVTATPSRTSSPQHPRMTAEKLQ
jgi:2,3-dihydroxyphenylpropionate 1,2-dioxygenase